MADPGERLGGAWAPALFLDQTKARGVEKIFWRPAPPLYLRIWMIAPPPLLTSRSGSGTVMYHPNYYNTSPMLSLFADMAGPRQGGIKRNTFYFSKYINSHDSFYWQIFHEPLTLNIFMYTKSTFESFYTLAIITTKHEADNRVDSTVSMSRKVGYSKVYL